MWLEYLVNHVEIAENCKSGRKAHTSLCPGDSFLQSTLALSARKGWRSICHKCGRGLAVMMVTGSAVAGTGVHLGFVPSTQC